MVSLQRWPTLIYQNLKRQHFPEDKLQQWRMKQRMMTGRHLEMKEKRQSERRAKEDFIYIVPENQKSVHPQSCNRNMSFIRHKSRVFKSLTDG